MTSNRANEASDSSTFIYTGPFQGSRMGPSNVFTHCFYKIAVSSALPLPFTLCLTSDSTEMAFVTGVLEKRKLLKDAFSMGLVCIFMWLTVISTYRLVAASCSWC